MEKTFCPNCLDEMTYSSKKRPVSRSIRGKEYEFVITRCYCNNCSKEVSPPGLIDLNVKEIDEQYRKAENIITIDEINDLMKIYNMNESTLSLALGFEEISVSRYLEGQVPSKEDSDVMKRAMREVDIKK